jgi:hypothetical protein
MDTSRLLYWIQEREAIRLRRAAGEPAPWTDDEILRTWSFCNVRRECDRVTIWIREHWREPHADDCDVWFAMAVARYVNWPDTLAELGYPVPWECENFITTLRAKAARGEKVWTPAYNINNAGKKLPKVEVVAGVLNALWARRKVLRPREDDSLLGFYAAAGYEWVRLLLRRASGRGDEIRGAAAQRARLVDVRRSWSWQQARTESRSRSTQGCTLARR